MIQLFPEYIEQIRAEAIGSYPEEAAWLITKKGCKKVRNIAEDRENFFDISAKDTALAMKQGLLAVVHSHTNGLHYPSEQDMHGQVHTQVPWGIVVTDGEDASRIRWWGGNTPDQVEDLLDRTFSHGATDCYALVRDYYKVKLGITLPEFPREWKWWESDRNTLAEGFPSAGFKEIDISEIREGDVWLAYLHNDKLCHCGIYLGNDLAQHHPGSGQPVNEGHKAVITPIFRYLPYIGKWLRHKDMPD